VDPTPKKKKRQKKLGLKNKKSGVEKSLEKISRNVKRNPGGPLGLPIWEWVKGIREKESQ